MQNKIEFDKSTIDSRKSKDSKSIHFLDETIRKITDNFHKEAKNLKIRLATISLSPGKLEFLNENVSILRQFFTAKKNFPTDITLQAFSQLTNIINIY